MMLGNGNIVYGCGYIDKDKVYHAWIDNIKPIKGLPDGKRKYRFRNNEFAEVFVKEPNGNVRRFALIINDDKQNPAAEWSAIEEGANKRSKGTLNLLNRLLMFLRR